ncbi:hypothetical protein [Micromonospora costi]|uniref:Uncharacterized protein n=1 Tax=Micromonospora costi TaxID=1530042 RepID=A0A3A9ZYK8_9ACTN|nr:hypothetical protein [Micromonospora costi]RKN53190.1 hypothetical protein D7193_22085 [Micromonospora costi]
MAKEQMSPVKDKNYDLIRTLQMSLEHVYRMETYINDAEQRGDNELADWFRMIRDNNRKAGDQGKQMLMTRMQQEKR